MTFSLSVFKAGKFSRVPEAANFAVSSGQRLRNPFSSFVVQAEPHGYPPRNCKRNVVPGQLDLLKSIVTLEVSQAILLLLSVREIRIPEM